MPNICFVNCLTFPFRTVHCTQHSDSRKMRETSCRAHMQLSLEYLKEMEMKCIEFEILEKRKTRIRFATLGNRSVTLCAAKKESIKFREFSGWKKTLKNIGWCTVKYWMDPPSSRCTKTAVLLAKRNYRDFV